MKKLIALIVIFVCVGSALSAQMSMSIGGGLNFGLESFKIADTDSGTEEIDDSITGLFKDSLFTYGAYGFIDFSNYVELSLGISFITIIPVMEAGIYAKFPINLGALTIFPIAGVEYNTIIFILNSFWLRFGLGLDIGINETMFLRTELLYGFSFNHSIIIVPIEGINRNSFKLRAAIGFKIN